jgi:hypothetical protein
VVRGFVIWLAHHQRIIPCRFWIRVQNDDGVVWGLFLKLSCWTRFSICSAWRWFMVSPSSTNHSLQILDRSPEWRRCKLGSIFKVVMLKQFSICDAWLCYMASLRSMNHPLQILDRSPEWRRSGLGFIFKVVMLNRIQHLWCVTLVYGLPIINESLPTDSGSESRMTT